MNLLKAIILRFDGWLSRLERVEPFSQDPVIILRVQNGRAGWQIPLAGRLIPANAPVLVLHFWNERIPLIPSQGPDLQWALQFQRRLLYSFKAIARHLQQTSQARDADAVGGVIAQIRMEEANGGRLLLERLGFTVFPYHRPAGAFGEFWENFYTWLLIWAYNPVSLRFHALHALQRNEFWMTKEHFLERFL